jgi:hypothetical protein
MHRAGSPGLPVRAPLPNRTYVSIQSQSAGLLESVFRGKQYALLQDGSKKVVVDGLLFGEPLRSDRHERKSRLILNFPHRPAEGLRRRELFFRAFRHEAQVHVATGRASPRACEPKSHTSRSGSARSIASRQRASVSRWGARLGGRYSRRSFTTRKIRPPRCSGQAAIHRLVFSPTRCRAGTLRPGVWKVAPPSSVGGLVVKGRLRFHRPRARPASRLGGEVRTELRTRHGADRPGTA